MLGSQVDAKQTAHIEERAYWQGLLLGVALEAVLQSESSLACQHGSPPALILLRQRQRQHCAHIIPAHCKQPQVVVPLLLHLLFCFSMHFTQSS